MMTKKSLHLYAFIAGIFFLVSGIGKILDTEAFARLIHDYGFGKLAVLAPFISIAEIALGLLLLFGQKLKLSSFYGLILMVVFTASFAYGYLVHDIRDCGCFGTLKALSMPPLMSFIRNAVLIVLLIFVYVFSQREGFDWSQIQKNTYFISLGIAIFIAGLTFNKNVFLKIGSKPKASQDLTSKPIEDTPLNKWLNLSPDSTYAVLAFSYSCPHCLNSIENVSQYEKSGIVDRVIALGTGSKSDETEFYTYFNPGFFIKDLSQLQMIQITRKVPTTFFIKNNEIRFMIQSVAPSPLTLKKQGFLERYFEE